VTTAALKEQALWLSNKGEDRGLRPRRRPASSTPCARSTPPGSSPRSVRSPSEAGLKSTTSGEPKDESDGQFSVHTLQFSVTKVDWATLKQFYLA
jgi:hypothetical protein